MNDRDFLIWIHERLVHVHGESQYKDFMHKLRAVIRATPADQETPNVASCNDLAELDALILKDAADMVAWQRKWMLYALAYVGAILLSAYIASTLK